MASQIKTGALLSYAALGINILIGLLYTPWMIHSIGTDNFGLYTLAMSIITLFVFDFGLSMAITRFVAKYLAEGREDKANDCLGLTYKMYIAIDALMVVVLTAVYFFIPQIYEKLTPEEISKFKVVYVVAAAFSVLSFPFIPLNGILNATEKFIQLKTCEIIHKLIVVVAMSGCLLLGYGLYALVLVNAIAGLVNIVMKLICVRRYTSLRVNFGYSDRKERNELLKFSGWTTVASLAQRLIFNIAPSILGMVSGSASIAVFGVAITIEGYTYTFASALNGMFLPRVSRIMSDGEDGDVLPLMIRIGRIQLIIISAIFIGFVCLGRQFIELWVGPDFSATYLCAVLIVFPSVIQLPQEIAATAIVVANRVKEQALVYVCMAVVNIALAFLLAKWFGAVGLATSICMAYMVRTIGLNVIYHKVLKINIYRFFRDTFGKMGLSLIMAIALGAAINRFIPMAGWDGFLLKGSAFVAVFTAVMWFVGMNTDERNLVKSFVKR